MSIRFAFDVYGYDAPNGTRLARLLPTKAAGGLTLAYRRPYLGYSMADGQIVVHSDHEVATSAIFAKYNLVKVKGILDNDTEFGAGGFILHDGEFTAVDVDRGRAGRVLKFQGPNPLFMLDRAILLESIHAPDQPYRGSGDFGYNLPGMWHWLGEHPAAILVRGVEEGQNQPGTPLEHVTLTFTRTQDSDGNPWPDVGTEVIEHPIGTKVLDLALYAIKRGVILHMDEDLNLYAYQTYGDDLTGASYGAGVVRFDRFISNVGRKIRGSVERSHVLVQSGDTSLYAEVDGGSSPVGYWDFLKSPSQDTLGIEADGEWDLAQREIQSDAAFPVRHPAIDDASNGKYVPFHHYEPGDIVTIDTGDTDSDFSDHAIEVAALRIMHNEAGKWFGEPELGSQYLSADNQAWEERAARIIQQVRDTIPFCDPAIACQDLPDALLTTADATNGDAEDTGGGQWSGGAYHEDSHGGTYSYGSLLQLNSTIVFAFNPAQVFMAGVRYVVDVWSQRHSTVSRELKFGDPDVDEATGDGTVQETEVGADGQNWARSRICWTPTANRTGVRVSFHEVQDNYQDTGDDITRLLFDDLVLYTADNDPLAGTSTRVSRCDHGHHARDIPLRPPPGMTATDVQAGIDELAALVDSDDPDSDTPTTAGDFVAGGLSNPPTQAEVEAVIGSAGAVARGTVYGLQDSGTTKRYLALSDGVQWHIVPLVVPTEASGVAALTSAPAGGWAQTHSVAHYNGVTYFAYVRGDNGNVELRTYTHATATVSSATVLHSALLADLHAAPSLVVRQSDRRIHVFYSDHAGEEMYQWISTNAEDISAGTETDIASQLGASGYTYAMVADLDSGLYLFVRDATEADPGQEWDYSVSTDDGTTWSSLVNFYKIASRHGYVFAQKTGDDRVDFIAIDGLSLESDDSIQFFTFDADAEVWSAADGTSLTLPIGAQSEIMVWDGSTLDDARGRFDVIRGPDGHPRLLFGSINGSTFTYRHGRWTGSEWAFSSLVAGSSPVAVSARFDSLNPNVVYLSDGSNEIRRFTTLDETTWTGETLTSSTTSVYPISPPEHAPDLPVVWLTGTYTDASTYSLGVTGFGASDASADEAHAQRIVVLDDTALDEAILRRNSEGTWQISRDDGSSWEDLGGGAPDPADVRDAGRWEVVVDGSPPEAVLTPDGTDWVYGWVSD